MRVLIVDGQGGGMGKALVEQLKQLCPTQPLLAVGTNALATAAMLRAGADQGATGENAVVVNAARADLILGPMGIVLCDALMGEITERMACAIGRSPAHKVLIPVSRCQVTVAGCERLPATEAVALAAREAAGDRTAARAKFLFYLLLGLGGIWISRHVGADGFWLTLVRLLFLLPFYGAGILYRRELEAKDKLKSPVYFGIILLAAMAGKYDP